MRRRSQNSLFLSAAKIPQVQPKFRKCSQKCGVNWLKFKGGLKDFGPCGEFSVSQHFLA